MSLYTRVDSPDGSTTRMGIGCDIDEVEAALGTNPNVLINQNISSIILQLETINNAISSLTQRIVALEENSLTPPIVDSDDNELTPPIVAP